MCSVFANQGALIIYNACSNRELGGLKSRKDIIRARMCYYGLVCGRGEIINIGATSCIGETQKEKNNNQSQRISSLSCIIILYESKKKCAPGPNSLAKMLSEFDLSARGGVIACHGFCQETETDLYFCLAQDEMN